MFYTRHSIWSLVSKYLLLVVLLMFTGSRWILLIFWIYAFDKIFYPTSKLKKQIQATRTTKMSWISF